MATGDDELIDRADRVETLADFQLFAAELLANFRQHPDSWENGTLDSFLESLVGFTQDINGYYRNWEPGTDCSVASWRILARILLAASIYE